MNLQDYLLALPYKMAWHIVATLRLNSAVVFYCADPLDYVMFEPIQKYLPTIPVIAKNHKTAQYLRQRGVRYTRLPAFPQAVIMARHTPYKFPVRRIIKIGFDHGLYQFKRWTSPKYYNGFHVYFVSSKHQVYTAHSRGIKTTKAIGYPKLDALFDGTYDSNFQKTLQEKLSIDPYKKTLLFSATWNVDGMSALDRWIDRVQTLAGEYNVLVTVHTWTAKKQIQKLKHLKGVVYLNDYNVAPYFLIADLLIGDSSSILGEFCALDKPMITFRVPVSHRSLPDIRELIADISLQIDHFDELREAIQHCLAHPEEKAAQRKKARDLMYLALDGKAGARAAAHIREQLASLLHADAIPGST